MEIYFSMVNFNGVLNGNIKQFHENGNLFYEGGVKNENQNHKRCKRNSVRAAGRGSYDRF